MGPGCYCGASCGLKPNLCVPEGCCSAVLPLSAAGTPGSRPGAASAAKKASAATPAAAAGSIGGGGGAAATPEPAAALAASRPELSVGHLPPSEQPTTAAQAPIDSSSLQGAGDGSGRSSGRSSASGVHSAAALPTGLSAAALKPQQKSVVGEKRQSWPQSASPAVLLRAQKGQKGAQHSRSGVAAGAAAYPWLNDLGQHYVDCFRQELLEVGAAGAAGQPACCVRLQECLGTVV